MSTLARVAILLGLFSGSHVAVAGEASPDPEALSSVADAAMANALREHDVAGGVLVVVKDGRVLLAKGYGLADRETKRPMDAGTTRLRVASVSKVVTATAVMQLVEQGRIGLDDDVNRHLRTFRIDDTFPEPVRVRHLLTHTAGFDERLAGTLAVSSRGTEPLSGHLAANMPPRLAAPGDQWLYSNHGIALAGHLVETVSGLPFSEYLDKHVFEPLGMTSSSFILTPEAERDLATGYVRGDERWRALYTHLKPAAALTTTGADIARFMIAHLEGGAAGSGRILRPETLRLMHARHFAIDRRGAGMALGFFEQFPRGVRALLHDGDWGGYSSRLLIVPGERLGVFASFNAWSAELRAEVVGRVVDSFRPGEPTPHPSRGEIRPFTPDVRRLEGPYRDNRYPHRGPMKLAAIKPETYLDARDDGTVEVAGVRFAPVEPGLFRSLDGASRLIVTERAGRVRHVTIDSPVVSGFVVLEPVAWYETRAFHRSLSVVLRVVSATTFVWVLAAVFRRPPAPFASRARAVALAAAVPIVLGPVWIGALLGALGYGLSPGMRLVSMLPAVLAVLSVVLAYYTVVAFRRRLWSKLARVHYALVTACVIAYVGELAFWNLLPLPG